MRTDDSKSLKAGFVEIMEAKIFSGELKPGDRLPPERELALQLGISRGSVNQGILDMAHGLSAHRTAPGYVCGGLCPQRDARDAGGDHEL